MNPKPSCLGIETGRGGEPVAAKSDMVDSAPEPNEVWELRGEASIPDELKVDRGFKQPPPPTHTMLEVRTVQQSCRNRGELSLISHFKLVDPMKY
jgi:hypothetical protein